MYAARELAQLVLRGGEAGHDVVELRREVFEFERQPRLHCPQLDPERDQPLLGAVV